MIGKTLAHYEITGLLGQGGMGEVYRAHDTRLKRDIALKVLPAEMAGNPDRLERFQREAETVAGLSHPEIVTLFSVEESDGIHFLTMELVEGQTLDELLTPGGLPLARVLDIGTAIADALSAAHDKGIIHRDLKPANVKVGSTGRVKVLDFGLAKLVQPDSSSEHDATQALDLTQTGTVMGTVPYMSPEQLRAKNVDHRSDLFSLGTVLYELATGARPFQGTSSADLTSAIIRDTPPPIQALNPAVPTPLSRLVEGCLEKDPEDRYQSAEEIARELRALRETLGSGISVAPAQPKRNTVLFVSLAAVALVAVALAITFLVRDTANREVADEGATPGAATTAAHDSRSIAVLAFADMSPDRDQEYFSDGIAEELLNLLAKVPELRVISRSSAFSYKGKDLTLAQIAGELRVAHILEGSVRKAGDQLRITAQLVEAQSDTQLWSKTYDRTLEDVFAIQDEIAADVVGELKLTLLGDAPRSAPTDPLAYDLYLRAGPHVEWGMGPRSEDLTRGITLLEEAVRVDPGFAMAHARLSQAQSALFYIAGRDDTEMIEQALRSAEAALRVDPDLPEGHLAVALYHSRGNSDYESALAALAVAREVAPANAQVLSWTGTIKKRQGRMTEARDLLEQALERDPRNPTVLGELAVVHHLLGASTSRSATRTGRSKSNPRSPLDSTAVRSSSRVLRTPPRCVRCWTIPRSMWSHYAAGWSCWRWKADSTKRWDFWRS